MSASDYFLDLCAGAAEAGHADGGRGDAYALEVEVLHGRLGGVGGDVADASRCGMVDGDAVHDHGVAVASLGAPVAECELHGAAAVGAEVDVEVAEHQSGLVVALTVGNAGGVGVLEVPDAAPGLAAVGGEHHVHVADDVAAGVGVGAVAELVEVVYLGCIGLVDEVQCLLRGELYRGGDEPLVLVGVDNAVVAVITEMDKGLHQSVGSHVLIEVAAHVDEPRVVAVVAQLLGGGDGLGGVLFGPALRNPVEAEGLSVVFEALVEGLHAGLFGRGADGGRGRECQQ